MVTEAISKPKIDEFPLEPGGRGNPLVGACFMLRGRPVFFLRSAAKNSTSHLSPLTALRSATKTPAEARAVLALDGAAPPML